MGGRERKVKSRGWMHRDVKKWDNWKRDGKGKWGEGRDEKGKKEKGS